MAYSAKTYTGDGSTTDFTVTFDYLDQTHVKAAVNTVRLSDPSSEYQSEFINSTTLRITHKVSGLGPESGDDIEIFRETPITTPAVVFGQGASLTTEDLNKLADYLTYALQEATDDNDAFNVLFLGAKEADPTVDNNGDALIAGAIYFNSIDQLPYYYDGTSWIKGDSTVLAEAAQAAAESARDAAQSSATAAATSETNAATSATNAASSASAASTSETNAASSASAASTSETNAASSASAASTSETNAASSASAASTSETNAASSETNAASSASAASTSETNAATSESNAASSASAAAASFDSFDDRYLGAKASDPTLDNDGDILITGALYFNSTDGELKAYDGAAWQVAYVPSTGFVGQTGTTGSAELPVGTTAQRDGTPAAGYIRFNSTDSTFEGYDGTAWGAIGGAGGGLFKGENGEVGSSAGDIFRVNEQTLNTNVTIDADENASATGPLTVASGVTLTVTSGGNLSIV